MSDSSSSRPLVTFDGVSKDTARHHPVPDEPRDLRRRVFGHHGALGLRKNHVPADVGRPGRSQRRRNHDGQRINEIAVSKTRQWSGKLALFPFLNVQKNVEFGLKCARSHRRNAKRARKWLERMESSNWLSVISVNSRRTETARSIARSLVTEPRILLLDEPLSALDANLVIRMQGVLSRLQKELGITFVYVTHSQSEAFAMSDRVVIMSQGRIEQLGSPKEIYRSPASRFVADFVGANNILSEPLLK